MKKMQDRIECPICHKWFYSLVLHIIMKHKMTIDDFKKKFPECIKFHSNHRNKLISKGMKGDNNPAKKEHTKRNMKKAWKIRKLTFVSPFKKTDSKESIQRTEIRLMKSKQTIINDYKNGREPWNKGLTKETDPRMARLSELVRYTQNSPEFDKENWLKNLKKSHRTKQFYNWFFNVQLPKWNKSSSIKPNKLEKRIIKIFSDFQIPVKYVGDHKLWIGHKNPDFISDDKKSVIEIFGDYWHSRKITGHSKEKEEQQRINHFAKYGYECLIIWEHEINNINMFLNKVLHFLNIDKPGQILEYPDYSGQSVAEHPIQDEGSETNILCSNAKDDPGILFKDKDIVRTPK